MRGMTVREVAIALMVTERTIQRHASALGLTKDGKMTLLDEKNVTQNKQAIERSGRNDLDNIVEVSNATTELEIAALTAKVLGYWQDRAKALALELQGKTEALALATPKVESYDRFLGSGGTMCISDVAKVLGRPPLSFFGELERSGMIFRRGGDWLPTQSHLDEGYFEVKARTYGEPPNQHITRQTRVTAKGIDGLAKLFPRGEDAHDRLCIASLKQGAQAEGGCP